MTKPRSKPPGQTHKKPHPKQTNPGLWFFWLFALAGLLCIPGIAIWKLSKTLNPNWISFYLICISLVTLNAYGSDKRNAQQDKWRISEQKLHFLELLGGWPAAFLAQRIFWHKISKESFQIPFAFIVIFHQMVAFDYYHDWAMSLEIFRHLKPLLEQLLKN